MTDAKEIKEIERGFLGSLLQAAIDEKISPRLNADDFEYKKYGRIYETILKQRSAGIIPDLITIHKELEDISPDEIADLTTAGISAANISYYENQIYEASKTRLFVQALQTAKEEIDKRITTDTIIKNLLPALAAVTTARNEAGIKSAAELLKTQFPEIRWIVPGMIGEGLTLINGAPKIGKSWFVLNLAIAAASGGGFLGTLKATKTGTLYMALEDTERRINSRLKQLKAPEADNLKITTQWRDGYIGLENYLKANSEIGLVVIDTLARFANIEDMNDYSITTNAMARLKRIADDLNIAIVLIHHAKKTGQKSSGADWMESALGSTGLTGATDSTIFIGRNRNHEKTEQTAALYATGRDAADIKYYLKLDLNCGGWTITDALKPGPDSSQRTKDKSRGSKIGNTNESLL